MDNALHRRSSLSFDIHVVEIVRSKHLRNAVVMLLSVTAITLTWMLVRHTPTQTSTAPTFQAMTANQINPENIVTAHLFGQDPDALKHATPLQSTASVNVQGLLYSPDPDSALAILEVDGTTGVFRKGDALSDGEKIAAIDVAGVQLSDGISIRVVQLSQKFGNQVPGISINGTQSLMGDIAISRQTSVPGQGLQPVVITPGNNPIDQLKSLRQQLIQH